MASFVAKKAADLLEWQVPCIGKREPYPDGAEKGDDDEKQIVVPPDVLERSWCRLEPNDVCKTQACHTCRHALRAQVVGEDLAEVEEGRTVQEDGVEEDVDVKHCYTGGQSGLVGGAQVHGLDGGFRGQSAESTDQADDHKMRSGQPVDHQDSEDIAHERDGEPPSLEMELLFRIKAESTVQQGSIVCRFKALVILKCLVCLQSRREIDAFRK